MKTPPRAALSIVVLSLVLVLTGCSSDSDVPTGATTPSTTTSEVPAESDTPAEEGPLLDGGQEVQIRTYMDTFLAPSVEGGVVTVDDPAASEVPAQWVITPVVPGGETYQLVTVALTDGVPSCLALAAEADVSLAVCDPADPAQEFEVTALDSADQVALSTSAGHLGVDPDSGMLEVFTTGDQLSSTFTLVVP